ncbi:MAG: error-prone DNA polymerase [Phycisphaerales bacterium]
MPENEFPKIKAHPFREAQQRRGDAPTPAQLAATPYAELAVTSNYTFLTGASHPEEFVDRAADLGHAAAAIADTNTLAGVVRAHVAAKERGIPLAVGSRLVMGDGLAMLAFATDRPAYSRLSRLLTLGKRRAPKGECHLELHDLLEHQAGLLAVVVPPAVLDEDFIAVLHGMRETFDDRLSMAAARTYRPDDHERFAQLAALSQYTRVPLVASNDAHYHDPGRRELQDVLTCIRHGCTVDTAGYRLHPNAERHLKPADEMARLFRDLPGAVERAAEVALRATAFSMDELRYQYPAEACPEGMSPPAYLRRETLRGAERRYPDGVPEKVRGTIEHELALIAELGYEAYFLTCYDIMNFARMRGILCQGRGGAANSAVCYCLGITEVDPSTHSVLFERFISRSRGEPPDIDIDFEHERREEVIQYLYQKYGRDRAALTAEVITYRGRSAVREVGKALGLSLDGVDTLARNLDRWGDDPGDGRIREAGFDPEDPTMGRIMRLTRELIGFPRHLSQHVGGFVITNGPLHDLVPIENAAMEDRTVIEWDKDDIDAMGMLKVDCLGLGMLTCVRKSLEFSGSQTFNRFRGIIGSMADPAVYDMICRADTVGVFQIESRAQMSMLPRLKPRCFYDLVIEVAIVRPGPIQGDMVHPYLRRREGAEPVSFPSEEVRAVLERTLGVPLFQEQAMQLAICAGGFTPDEADALRRAMAAWKRKGDQIYRFGQKLVDGMTANGYPRDFAERCFEQIRGFSEYGFPESHAASFAILVWVSCWLKRHEPAAFCAALINSQPMGFYQPAQIVRDAREHGVEVRPIDVNKSAWDCTLEGRDEEIERRRDEVKNEDPTSWGSNGPAVRLGMRLAKGMVEADAHRIADAVAMHGPFETVERLWRASQVSVRSLRALANADAFNSMGLDRQRALWQIKPLRDDPLPLFDPIERDANRDTDALDDLPAVPANRMVLEDYASMGLSLKAHPMSFIRETLDTRGVTPTSDLRRERLCPQGREVSVAGLVLMRQRPGTASGVVFITLEDETGIANLILWKDTFEQFRRVARLSRVMLAHGRIERQGEVVHVHVHRLECLDEQLDTLVVKSRDFH